jgi:hypothetical protein
MEARRIGRPVALDRAQPAGGVGDRGDVDLARIEPNVLRPGDRARRPAGDQQPLRGKFDRAELARQLGGEAFGREIGGARRRRGFLVRRIGRRLRGWIYAVRPSRRTPPGRSSQARPK